MNDILGHGRYRMPEDIWDWLLILAILLFTFYPKLLGLAKHLGKSAKILKKEVSDTQELTDEFNNEVKSIKDADGLDDFHKTS